MTDPILVPDSDAESESGERDDVPEDDTRRLLDDAGIVSSYTWQETCDFFNHPVGHCDPENEGHRYQLPGTSISLKSHQLVAVYRLVFSVELSGNLGTLLADTMGLGKTFEVAGAVAVFHALVRAFSEIAHNQQLHCPKHTEAQLPKEAWVCPSGKYTRFGFTCPCIPGSKAHNLVLGRPNLLPRGPTVLLIPPGLVSQWCKELRAYFTRPGPFQILRFAGSSRRPEPIDGVVSFTSYDALSKAITQDGATVSSNGGSLVHCIILFPSSPVQLHALAQLPFPFPPGVVAID